MSAPAAAPVLELRNPHAALAALKRRPADVLEIQVGPGEPDAWQPVVAEAARARVRVSQKARGGGAPSGRDDAHRGASSFARVRPRAPVSVEQLFSPAAGKPDARGLWLALDQIQDPQNLGAVFRVAAFFGVRGVLIPTERSAPLTAVVYDVACGGVEDVPFAETVNLQRGFEKAKDAGLWILGTSERAKGSLFDIEADRAWLLVLGNEEKGMRRLTEEACDVLCGIPSRKGSLVGSLNVGTAAAISISHLSR